MFEINPDIFTLSNGIRVVYLKRKAFVAHLGVMIHAGSRFETEDTEGLAHFLEHCIFKGTEKRNALDIITDLDSVGGELNAYTNKEEICVHASFRKIHFEIASELLGDIVQNSTFPEDEIQKEKEIVLDEINSYLDSPSERIFDEFEARIFKNHPLGFNTLGTKKNVNSFHREHLLKYARSYFVPENMVISFVGDIPLENVRDQLEANFGSSKGELVKKENPILGPLKVFNRNEKKANYQTHTVIGGRAPSFNDDERRAMALLINVLGGPASNSRLMLLIREKYGYAYNVEAGFSSFCDTGMWSIYLGTDKKYLQKALVLIEDELKNVTESGLSEKELSQAKEQLKGHLALSLDSNLELMFSLGKSILLFGKVDSIKDIYKEIDAITNEEIKHIARKYFSKENTARLIYSLKK